MLTCHFCTAQLTSFNEWYIYKYVCNWAAQKQADLRQTWVYYPFASTHMVNTQLLRVQDVHTGFLLIFLTAGNLIAIGGYKMPGVWGPGAAPRRGPRGSAPGGVKGQSPLRGPGAAPLEAIRFSQSDKVKSTQPVMHKWPS